MDLRCYNGLWGIQSGPQRQKCNFGESFINQKDHGRNFLNTKNFIDFFIFRINPYWEILIFDTNHLQNKITNVEILAIIWFCTFLGFLNARLHKFGIQDIPNSIFIFATKYPPWVLEHQISNLLLFSSTGVKKWNILSILQYDDTIFGNFNQTTTVNSR